MKVVRGTKPKRRGDDEMMTNSYPILANCNFADRDDEVGVAIQAAADAVRRGWTTDGGLIDALDRLEAVLEQYADEVDVESIRRCENAERAVADAWTDEVQGAAEAVRQSRYVD
jgi:hypothetical protein